MVSVEQIIERLGGVASASRKLEVAHSSLIKWRKSGRVPRERVLQVAHLTGFQPAEIRPDLVEQAKLLVMPASGCAA